MNAKELGRYYTPEWAASALIDRVPGIPRRALDMCCGAGALARAAAARWQLQELVTVDIDPALTASHLENLTCSARHIQTDALSEDFRAALDYDSFDLVLCNPPYGRRRHGGGRAVVASADLEPTGPWPAAEIVGLAQALLMARRGGIVAVVMPDTFATGKLAKRVRKIIIQNHRLVSVTELPRGTFANTDAKTYLLVIEVNGITDKVSMDTMSINGEVVRRDVMDAHHCVERMDLSSYSDVPKFHLSLSSLGAEVVRGRVRSSAARDQPEAFFHTSNFSNSENGMVRLSGKVDSLVSSPGKIIALPGDILVARVDRRLEEKVALVVDGAAEITDCVFRIRSCAANRERIWASLRSPTGKASLVRASRGVGPRHLAMRDLLGIHI